MQVRAIFAPRRREITLQRNAARQKNRQDACDDARCVRRSVRLRSHIGCGKCGQIVGTTSELAQTFGGESTLTSPNPGRRVEHIVSKVLSSSALLSGLTAPEQVKRHRGNSPEITVTLRKL